MTMTSNKMGGKKKPESTSMMGIEECVNIEKHKPS